MIGRFIIGLSLCIVVLVLMRPAEGALAPVENGSHSACIDSKPQRLPEWSMSGVFRNGNLLLADSGASTILNFAPGRGYLREERSPLADLMSLRPFAIKPLQGDSGGWAVQFKGGRFITLDDSMSPRDQIELFTETRRGDERVESVESAFNWTTGGGFLYTCSDYKSGELWNTGLVRIPLQEPSQFKVVREFTLEHPMYIHCRLGYELLSTIGSTAFALVMEDEPRIEVFAGEEWEGVSTIELELGERPEIPNYESRDGFALTMRVVEMATMPVSVIARDEQLYVLSRRPGIARRTIWSLTRIDPHYGEVLGNAELPSVSPHLTIVPGEEYWAFVEKGSVRRLGDQDTSRIMYIASERIKNLDSGQLCAEPGT